MKNSSTVLATSKQQFNWSDISSGKSITTLKEKVSNIGIGLGNRQDSSESEEEVEPKSLWKQASKDIFKTNSASLDDRHKLKSARQRSLLETSPCSKLTLNDSKNNRHSNGLRKAWPSTAKQRTRYSTLTNFKPSNFSAGSRDFLVKEPSCDSAGSLGHCGSGADLLVEAVRFGRIRHIKLLLDGGTDVNTLDSEGKIEVFLLRPFHNSRSLERTRFY